MLINTLNSTNERINTNSFNLKLMQFFADIVIELDQLISSIDVIYEGINSGETGIVSPALVSPDNFIKGLLEVKKN